MATTTMDVIHNRTETKYSLMDRLKILIGGTSITELEMETKNEIVYVEKTTVKTHVILPNWLRRKRKMGLGYSETVQV